MISVATIRAYLGLDSSQDSMLGTLLAQAVDVVEQETGEYYGVQQHVREVLDGLGAGTVWVNNPATEGDDAVVVEIREATTGTWSTVDAETYELAGRELVRFGDAWPMGQSNLRVTYYRGEATASGAADAALLALVALAARSGGDGGAAVEIDLDGMKEKWATSPEGKAPNPFATLPRRPASSRNDSRVTVIPEAP